VGFFTLSGQRCSSDASFQSTIHSQRSPMALATCLHPPLRHFDSHCSGHVFVSCYSSDLVIWLITNTFFTQSMTLLSGFVSYAQVYRVVHIDKTRPKQVNPDADVSSLVYSDDVQHIFWVPVAVTILALLHLVGRFLWHYIWEYAYGWRVWRRYKAAVEGNDTVEENRFRDRHVFIEVLYFFEKNHIASIKAAARRAKAFFRPKNKREGEGDP
jgi:hypothetical protein